MKWLKPRNVLLVMAAIAILSAAYLLLNPTSTQAPGPSGQQATRQNTIKTYDLKVEGSRLVAGPNVITVKQNETVKLRVTADTKDELHLHGYDKKLELEPGKTVEVTFLADMSGSFEAELHESEAPVFVLEVYPE